MLDVYNDMVTKIHPLLILVMKWLQYLISRMGNANLEGSATNAASEGSVDAIVVVGA